jgi:hypothetical protein
MSIPSSISTFSYLIVKIQDRFDDTISILEDIATAVCNVNHYPSNSFTPLAFQSKTYMESFGNDDLTILEDYMEKNKENPLGYVVKIKTRISKGKVLNTTSRIPSYSSSSVSSKRHPIKQNDSGF